MSTASTTPDPSQLDYSQLLPNSGTLQSYAPLPYQAFGNVPQLNAATMTPTQQASTPGMQAATVDPYSTDAAYQNYANQLQTSLAPTFQQQNDQLTAGEADRGIFNSTAGQQLQNNLSGQQAGAIASGLQPLISQFAGYGQQDTTINNANQQAANQTNYQGAFDTNQVNAGYDNSAAAANMAALNNANQYNASAYGTVTQGNENDFNTYLNSLAGLGNTQQTALLNQGLTSYDPNNASSAGLYADGLNNASTAYNQAFTAAGANTGALASGLGTALAQFGNTTPAVNVGGTAGINDYSGLSTPPIVAGQSAINGDTAAGLTPSDPYSYNSNVYGSLPG